MDDNHFLGDLLPRVRQEHQRRIEIIESPPLQQQHNSNNDADNESSCFVCQTNQARYTCPRCMIPYCSLACYRKHDGGPASSANTAAEVAETGGYCTEAFSRDRVTEVVQLEAKEQLADTQRLLQKVYQSQREQEEVVNHLAERPVFQPTGNLSQEELLRILRVAEQGTPEEMDQLWMSSSLSPQMRQSLDHAIRNGHVEDWVLEPWHPWWRLDLSAPNDDDHNEDETSHLETVGKPLDERLLEVAPFSKHSTRKPTSLPDLRFNLVDILYSIILTLHVYHGATNALDNSFEAADTLIHASRVLSRDARWSSLEQCLMTITSQESGTTSVASNHGWPNAVLLEDVALVCQSHRLVAKALFEGLDILKAGRKSKEFNLEDGDPNHDIMKDKKTQWRRIVKKLEFYISWTKQRQDAGVQDLATCIQKWISDWETSEAEPGFAPPDAASGQQRSHGSPFISEVLT